MGAEPRTRRVGLYWASVPGAYGSVLEEELPDHPAVDVAAIEAEAVAAYKAELAEKVAAIRKREVRQPGDPGLDGTDPYIASILDEVLALIEEPS
jgi:hypothetical protein